jgi:PAS domain S-box-containing protein
VVELTWQDVPFAGRRARLVLARDVGERARADEELRESERRLRQLAENIGAVFWMTDAAAARLLYVSPRYEAVWGRTCDSLYQHPETWQQAIHPDDREAAARVFSRFVRDGNAYEQEYRVVRPDGSVRWVRDRGFPVRDVAGRVYRVAGIAEDVTERKQRDEELRRHVRQQEAVAVLSRSALAGDDPQALLDGAARLVAEALKVGHAAVWERDPAGAALLLRAGVGWGAGVVGRHTAAAGPDSPAGAALAAGRAVAVGDLRGDPHFVADPLWRAHGIGSCLGVPIPGPEGPAGVLAVYGPGPGSLPPEDGPFLQAVANVLAAAAARRRAVGALRESQLFTQAVLDSLAANVAVLDRRGTILAVNAGWAQFARDNGCADPARCGVGANYLAVCRAAAGAGAGGAAEVLRGLAGVLDGTLPLFTAEYPCHSPGRRCWFLLRATPCAAREGWAVVAHVDITELKLAEERLQEADRHKDEFLAMLAHELRNPLAPVRTALAIMKQPGAPAGDVGRVRDVMERQVQHMAQLIDDLLDVSRISRGRIELRKQVVDVAAVAGRAVEAVRPLLDERGHRLRVALPPGPLWLEADPVRLEQILTNLLSNSAKYTDPGGHIELAAERAGGEVVLRVKDTGIGIAPEMLPRVFDLFVQAERRLDRSRGGVGIGLTLVKRLAELHGGSVSAFSAGPGRGSEFTVRLPGAAGGPAPSAAPEAAGAAAPGRRVLVVDDNVDAADTLALLLRLAGHEVRVAYDGPSALGLAAEFRPQVVLLDLGMPVMDGYEVARRLRRQPGLGGVVLVALTGWGQEEERRLSRAAGIDHHLVKPIEPEKLHEVLALAAGGPS